MPASTSLLRPWWRDQASRLAGIDPRSLAAFRLALGAAVIYDLGARACDLAAHYSDAGVLSRAAARAIAPVKSLTFPLYFADGSAAWSGALLALTAVAALALAAGYRSRWAATACWYLVSCLQARNPMVNDAGDDLLRILLFWAAFLPLGMVWSLDDRRRRHAVPTLVFSAATFAVVVQICVVNWSSASQQSGAAWRVDRTALLQALHLDYITSSWGHFLGQFPDFLAYATRLLWGLEILGPILVWSPFLTGPIRSFAALAFIQIHLVGLAPALDLGLLPWVSAASWLLILPQWFWNQITERWQPAPGGSGRRGPPSLRRPTAWRKLESGLVALLLAIALLSNLRAVRAAEGISGEPPVAGWIVEVLGLGQDRSLFAPAPATDDGWLLAPAELADGSQVDLWTGRPPAFGKPESVRAALRNSRWRKYIISLVTIDHTRRRPDFARYMCRTWNRNRLERRALEIDLIFMLETYSPSTGEGDPVALPLGRLTCDSVAAGAGRQKTSRAASARARHVLRFPGPIAPVTGSSNSTPTSQCQGQPESDSRNQDSFGIGLTYSVATWRGPSLRRIFQHR